MLKGDNPSILEAQESYTDAIGIMLHHDAITGVSRKSVADDYSRIISESLGNEVYQELIGLKVHELTGMKSSSLW